MNPPRVSNLTGQEWNKVKESLRDSEYGAFRPLGGGSNRSFASQHSNNVTQHKRNLSSMQLCDRQNESMIQTRLVEE